MSGEIASQSDPRGWFDGNQWAAVEKLRAEDAQTIWRLTQRIQELEGVLVYVRNFLPQPLKDRAEAILWPANREGPSNG